MQRINVHDAKTHLSSYLERVEQGEVFTICRNNVPIAELRAIPKPLRAARRLGQHKGQVALATEFFEPLGDAELGLWNGGGA